MLFDVDIATGATTNPRDTGITNLTGIAFSPSGTLFGLTSFFTSGTDNALYTFDTATGAPTLVGSTGLTLAEGDLAFDPTTGTLYGIEGLSGADRTLFTIDPTTGAATTIGAVGILNVNDLSAMAFDAAGNLFIVDTAIAALLRVNKATGAVLNSVPLSAGSLGPLAGLAFDPDTGIAYFANGGGSANNLYTLNTTTGALTLIRPTQDSPGWPLRLLRPPCRNRARFCSLVELVWRCSWRADGSGNSLNPTLELIERLAALIPPPRIHRHRYHGVLAPNAPLRAQVTALARPPSPALTATPPAQ